MYINVTQQTKNFSNKYMYVCEYTDIKKYSEDFTHIWIIISLFILTFDILQ